MAQVRSAGCQRSSAGSLGLPTDRQTLSTGRRPPLAVEQSTPTERERAACQMRRAGPRGTCHESWHTGRLLKIPTPPFATPYGNSTCLLAGALPAKSPRCDTQRSPYNQLQISHPASPEERGAEGLQPPSHQISLVWKRARELRKSNADPIATLNPHQTSDCRRGAER